MDLFRSDKYLNTCNVPGRNNRFWVRGKQLFITRNFFVSTHRSYVLLHSLKEMLLSQRTKQVIMLIAKTPTSDNDICHEKKEAATCTQ